MSVVLKINPPTQPKAKRSRVDWDGMEPHYRAGIRSLRDLAGEFGGTSAAIVKHAKTHNWTRDLKAKIQARADLKVSKAMVSSEVSALTKITEEVRIDVESTVQARIILSHRSDISRARALVLKLLNEVEVQTDNQESFAELAEVIIWKSNGDGIQTKDEVKRMERMQQLFDAVMSSPGRIDSMKKLSETMRTLIGLEREAFGLDKGIDKSQSVGEFLESLK